MIVHQGTQLTIKPDVYDVLRGVIDLSETPLYNRLFKGPDSPDATLFHYGFDAPDNPDNAGDAEGTEFDASTAESYGARANMYGRMQHYCKKFGVGEVAQGNQVFNTGGRDEYAYQMKMGLLKCMRSAEYTIVGGQEAQAGNKTTAFRTRGLERLLVDTANIAVQTDSATQVSSAFRMPAAQLVTLTVSGGDYTLSEDNVNAPLNSIFDTMKGKIDLDVFCTTKFKGKVSKMGLLAANVADMTIVRRFNQDAKDKTVTATIDTYHGDAGTARFQLHPWLRYDTGTQLSEAIGLDFRFGCLRMRQTPKAEPLDKTGGGKKGEITHTFGLQYVPKVAARFARDS